MSTKNVTLKEKVNGALGDTIFPATTTPNVYDSAKSQALSQTLVNTPDYEALGFAKFSTATAYNAGEKVYKDNGLYRFIADKTAGEWDVAKVEPWSIEQEIEAVNDAIRSLIPAQASADNKLADKAYVNDKVATDTATFRGTFNLVTDLDLTTEATQGQIATALGTAISGEDKNDYAFVLIPTSDDTPTEIARIDRYKYTGLQWAFEYSLNNSGFTAEQWAAINSGITSSLVTDFGAKYDKPAGGIPSTDMTEAVQTSLGKADTAVQPSVLEETLEDYAQKDGYYAGMAVGLADNLRGNVYADEQFSLRPTGGDANEVGGIGVVQQLKGAGAAIVQMFPEGSGHDFSGDVSLDGTGGNAEAPLRYSDNAGTVEMGYLLVMEAFISQTLSQAQLDAISAKDTGKADRDKAVWLTPAGAITSAPTIESGQTEVTFSGWRIAMRVKASEVRDASASSYWFTAGTAGRQVYDVAVAEGIDGYSYGYDLANGWNTKSAMEDLNHMAAQGLPTHQVKAMSALLAVTKIGIKTVKSRNLLNPQTGRALLKAYVNDDENFEDNEYTMLGGLPSGSTMAFTSLLTGKTETLTMLDSTHFVIPSDGWLQITGTLPESIIATWDGTKDNTAADEYATESHTWDVTQLFGTKDGGTEGHYYRFAKEGMRPWSGVNLADASGEDGCGDVNLGNQSWSTNFYSSYGVISVKLSDFITNGAPLSKMKTTKFAVFNSTGVSSLAYNRGPVIGTRSLSGNDGNMVIARNSYIGTSSDLIASMANVHLCYELATPITFTSLFLSASSTADELTAMPADAIPLSEIQFADNNWSIEEAIYDAPEADANGVITPTAVTGQMRIQYSIDAAEQIDTLQKEYAALEARVTALENA